MTLLWKYVQVCCSVINLELCTSMSISNKLQESITKFFESPSRDAFRKLIRNEVGEFNDFEFKEDCLKKGKLAKHILAMSNSGGGIIVVGVKDGDTLESNGIEKLVDKADIYKQQGNYLPEQLKYHVLDYSYKASEYDLLVGKTFQVILVENQIDQIPFLSLKDGIDIEANTLYIRRGTSSTIANNNEFRNVINKRIDNGASTSSIDNLDSDLKSLKLLYGAISKTTIGYKFQEILSAMTRQLGVIERQNIEYPDESYSQFIADSISKLKIKILRSLGI